MSDLNRMVLQGGEEHERRLEYRRRLLSAATPILCELIRVMPGSDAGVLIDESIRYAEMLIDAATNRAMTVTVHAVD